MITEDYVSFETAKLLKEKGFKHWCYKSYGDAVYHKGVPISFDEECDLKSEGLEDEIEYVEGGYLYDFGCDNRKEEAKVWAAPTLWVAMKWLREVYNIIIDVSPLSFNTKGSESFICNNWVFTLWENGNPIVSQFYGNQTAYPNYEEACEAAIKCGLENLILI